METPKTMKFKTGNLPANTANRLPVHFHEISGMHATDTKESDGVVITVSAAGISSKLYALGNGPELDKPWVVIETVGGKVIMVNTSDIVSVEFMTFVDTLWKSDDKPKKVVHTFHAVERGYTYVYSSCGFGALKEETYENGILKFVEGTKSDSL